MAVLILGWKLVTFALIWAAYATLPFFEEQRLADFYYPATETVSLSTAFTTWDSSRYLYLAEQGYSAGDLSNWFAPLYPFSIAAVAPLTGSSIAAGLLISNVASAAGLGLFYAIVRGRYGPEAARRALLLFMAFPTSFYLCLVYSEGLFLLLLMACLYFLYRRNYLAAAVIAFPLPLARLLGFGIVVPFTAFLAADAVQAARTTGMRMDWRWLARESRRGVYLLGPVAGLAAYLLLMKGLTGDALAAANTQDTYISDWGLGHLLEPWRLAGDFARPSLRLHGNVDSIIDRAFFAAFVASLPLVYRRVDKPVFVMCLWLGLTPLLGSFMSYSRYVMLAFPLYIAYGSSVALQAQRLVPRLAFATVLSLMVFLQVLAIALHVTNHWVA